MKKFIQNLFKLLGFKITKVHKIERKAVKLYKKYNDFTMINKPVFVDNLMLISEFQNTHGCLVECGIWRGGMSAAMAEILPGREVYLFDSFEGLPNAQEIDGKDAKKWQENKLSPGYYDNCKAEMEVAKQAMDKSNSTYYLVKGWFKDTLPNYEFKNEIAVLRLDGDWYESTMDCLKYLYPLVAKGGLIILDDYYTWDGCSRALHDYLSSIQSVSRIQQSEIGVAYLIKKD